MPAVHDERLLFGHFAQVAHDEAVLGPVLEDGAIAAVRDELLRVLGDSRVQVVLDHQHDGRGLRGLGRVMVNGSRVHRVVRHEPVHVDAAVGAQFGCEFRRELRVVFSGEIPERIGQRQFLLLGRQDVLSNRGMRDFWIARLGRGKQGGQAFGNGGLEIGKGRGGRGGGIHLRGLLDCGRVLSPCRSRRGSVCIRSCSNSRVCGGIVR